MDISALVRAGELKPRLQRPRRRLTGTIVIAAFDDAAKLVQRIQEQRNTDNGTQLPEEPTRELLESLALGPMIIRGHYDHDLKRFGEPYACGDVQARDRMKDVLISLQMSLVISLKTAYMDGIELDYSTLQTTSDDCRVNAGVCLGQMSQRLSDAAKARAFHPPSSSYSSGSGLVPPLSPSVGYSSTRSTFSSTAFPAPPTPEVVSEQFGQIQMSTPFYRPTSEDRKTFEDRTMSLSSQGSQEQNFRNLSGAVQRPQIDPQGLFPVVGVHRIDDADDRSLRRRSSQVLAPDDNILTLFPRPGGQPVRSASNGPEADRASYVSSGQNSQTSSSPGLSRTSTGHRSQASRDRFGPDDYSEQAMRSDGRQFSQFSQFSNSTVYDMYRSMDRQPSTTPATRPQMSAPASAEHVRFLQENSRPPRREPRSDSLNTARKPHDVLKRPIRAQSDGPLVTRQLLSRPSVSVPIAIEPSRTPPPTGPLPAVPSLPKAMEPSRTPPPTNPPPAVPIPRVPSALSHGSVASRHLVPTSNATVERPPSIHTLASSTAPSMSSVSLALAPPSGSLMLPTDKNLLGFCKGAFRLQVGLEKKAFSINMRPVGIMTSIPFWRCEKCIFEGPIHLVVNTSDDKKKKSKPDKVFDPTIRVSEAGGVRYRWAFLAKCHVTRKGVVLADTQQNTGILGSFGCIFCCAEGKSRGWLDTANSAGVVGGPVVAGGRNSDPAAPAVQATPIFGNVASFMQHLESVHRPQSGWPNAEMMGRFRVVVGRMAPQHEAGWDINFVPLG
jgi:hypothetical protein